MSTLSITRKTSNTLITASGFNTNYDEVEAVVNALTSTNLADGAVTVAKLGSDIARSGYGLSQHTDKTLQIDPSDTTPCIEITDGGVRVKVDGTTITRTASGLVSSSGTDHGALTGLTDDDHSQYLNTTRHDVVARHPIAAGGTGQITAGAAFAALAAGKLYDSGWFAVAVATAYSKTHSLGTQKVLSKLYYATDANGSNMVEVHSWGAGIGVEGGQVQQITTTTCVVQTSVDYVAWILTSSGQIEPGLKTSGYYKLIMLALE